MIVPRYWAEARVQERLKGRPVVVRRFGWSSGSEQEAVEIAGIRARTALERILAGEKLPRRERKLPYNGADGVPIREEVVSEHGNAVLTRNSYGARCLNTPNVLFVDIDFEEQPPARHTAGIVVLLISCAVAAGWLLGSWAVGIGFSVAALLFGYPLGALARRTLQSAAGGAEKQARERVDRFLKAHPEAHLRLYRTPAGLRVLAMHRTFDPREPVVAEYFAGLGADANYARMCRNQQCFRARVSPKPWRIGIAEHMRPRPGIWPVRAERMPERTRWIEAYERAAAGYAACRFLESLGSQAVNADARTVMALHDELCRATTAQPIA